MSDSLVGGDAAVDTPPVGDQEAKPNGEGSLGDGAEAPEDAQGDEGQQGAPETYEDFQLPENMEPDAEALERFAPLARELNLDQDSAQKLVSLYAEESRRAAEAQQQAWADMQEQWRSQAKADKEIGGKEFDAKIGVAKTALDAFGTPELMEALTATGTGNHPEFIRFLYRVGKEIGEGGVSFGKSRSDAPKTAAERLYPSQGKT